MVATLERPKTTKIDLQRIPYQEAFVFDNHRYVVLIGGRYCAKTASGTFKAIRYIRAWPGAWGVIVGPSYPQLNMSTMPKFLERIPLDWIVGKNFSADKMHVDISPDGKEPRRVYFRNAANVDSLRGFEGAWAWLDEAQEMDRHFLNILAPCLRQPGYPIQTWLTGTPKGRNFIYQMFVDPESRIKPVDGKEQVALYRGRSYDNPFVDPIIVRQLESQYAGNPKLFEQEVLGEFVAFEGLIFSAFSYETHVKPLPKDMRFKRVIGDVDFGISDPSVIHLIGEDESDRYWVFKEFYRKHCSGRDLLATLAEWQAEYHVQRYYCDPHGSTEIATLQAAGIPAVKGNPKIELGIRMINNLLEVKPGGPGLYFARGETPETLREIQTFSHAYTRAGDEDSFTDSIKKHQSDHAMDALRYGIIGMSSSLPTNDIIGIRFGG